MSNPHNKSKGNMPHQKSFFDQETLEIQARELLAKGKFRQAKDAFKDLCKIDKAKYLPELLQSYHGLANQMIQNGQAADAAKIIENIKALSSGGDGGGEVSLEIAIAMKKKDYEAIARVCEKHLSQKKDMSVLLEIPTVADALVVAFQEFPALKTACPAVHGELIAIQQALADVSGEKYDDAWGKVKGIGTHSLFSRWKLFIKGLVAFYKNEDEKALEAFGRVPSDTLLHNVARTYSYLLNKSSLNRTTPSEPVLQKICDIAGYPDLASSLPRAEVLWQSGRRYESYCHIFKTMQPFPGEGKDIAGILSRFYFNIIHHLHPKEAIPYLNALCKRAATESKQYSLEWMLLYKMDGLLSMKIHQGDNDMHCDDCVDGWLNFLGAYNKMHGDHPKMESLIYCRIGALFTTDYEDDNYLPFLPSFRKAKRIIRNERLAEKYYHQSIEADPGNKAAYLGLLNVYRKTHKKPKFNKLLDKTAPLFPDDAIIQHNAGMNCFERKAYIKAIKYLERANLLDPLNGEIKRYLVFAYLETARSYFSKRQISRGRKFYELALQQYTTNTKCFYRNRAFIYARWAAIELKMGNEAIALEKMRCAREHADKLLNILYFAKLLSLYYSMSDREIQTLCPELKQEWANPPTPENAVGLIEIYKNFTPKDGANPNWMKQEKEKIIKYASDASDKPCTRDDAHAIVDFSLFKAQEMKLGKTYINKMLQIDKCDPLFLLLKYKSGIPAKFLPGQIDIDELKRILPHAERRNEVELIREIKTAIDVAEKMIEMRKSLGSDFMSNDMDEDEDDYDYDETDDDDELF